ncbi:hypothetical protein CBL_06342 [Carabus blaptoides fortunei]
MDPARLSRDELEYELEVRGFPKLEMATALEMRETLSKLLKDEKIGTLLDRREAAFDRDADLTICTRKTVELQALASDITGSLQSSTAKRFFARLSHLLGRLARLTSEANDIRDSRILWQRHPKLPLRTIPQQIT